MILPVRDGEEQRVRHRIIWCVLDTPKNSIFVKELHVGSTSLGGIIFVLVCVPASASFPTAALIAVVQQ